MKYSLARTKKAAVTDALKEQIRTAKLKKLSDRLGKINIDEKAIEDGNRADLERAAWLSNIGVDGEPS